MADRDLALRVQAMTDRGMEVMDFVAWWNARRENLNGDDPITKGLTNLNLATAGAFSLEQDAPTRLVPVVRSSENSQRMLTAQLGFQIDPGALIQNFESSGEHQTVAARFTGPIKSAYPPVKAEVAVDPALEAILDNSSEVPTGVANILVLGDVDFLSDSNWIREERLGSISLGYRTFADNGSFMLNAIETMAGDPVLADFGAVVSTPGLSIELNLCVKRLKASTWQSRSDSRPRSKRPSVALVNSSRLKQEAKPHCCFLRSKKRKWISCRTKLSRPESNSDWCSSTFARILNNSAPI